MTEWEDMVLVGRIARPHGLRGQVVVNPETDFAGQRFRTGARLWTRSASGDEPLVVSSVRFQAGRPVIGFEGKSSLDAVERLAGMELRVPEEALQPLEPGRYYEHQLVGCAVESVSGERVGRVVRVEGGPGGSRLVVEGGRGEVLIPFAAEISVSVDVDTKKILIDPPEGLLELNQQ
ncbi:MAG: ribosome maturation factor RimM [Acidobacteria bacterium]|nr:ribosome maturation factor RimM [Acidobacteriota bacterium]